MTSFAGPGPGTAASPATSAERRIDPSFSTVHDRVCAIVGHGSSRPCCWRRSPPSAWPRPWPWPRRPTTSWPSAGCASTRARRWTAPGAGRSGAVRPGRPGRRDDPGQLRVVPGGAGPGRDDGGGRGRPRLPEHRQPRLLHRAVRRPPALAQPAAGRQPRDRHLGADQLPAAAALAPGPGRRRVQPAGRGLRQPAQHRPAASRRAARARQRPVRHRQRRPRPGRRAHRPGDRAGRSVRGLLRQLLRPDLRRPLPGAAPVADPGRHLAGAEHRPVLHLDHRDGPDRLRPGLPAQRGLRPGRPRVVDGPHRGPGRAAAPRPGGRSDPRAGQRPLHLEGRRRGPDRAGQQRRLRRRGLPRAGRRRPGGAGAPGRGAAAPAGRQVALHRRRRAGAGVVGRPVQRRLLHRLPAGVRHAGAAGRPPGPVRGRRGRPARRHLRAVHRRGVGDLAGGRVRRLPPLAGPGPRRPAHHRAAAPGAADPARAGPVGWARHPDHLDRRRHRGRTARPVGPLGQGGEHHPRDRAGRPLRLRQRAGPPVRPPSRAAAHHGRVLRQPHPRGPRGRRLPPTAVRGHPGHRPQGQPGRHRRAQAGHRRGGRRRRRHRPVVVPARVARPRPPRRLVHPRRRRQRQVRPPQGPVRRRHHRRRHRHLEHRHRQGHRPGRGQGSPRRHRHPPHALGRPRPPPAGHRLRPTGSGTRLAATLPAP